MTIKELREEKKLSQSALAKELGVATSAIGHMENGRMKVSAKIAGKVKELYGIAIDTEAKAEKAAKATAKKAGTAVKKAPAKAKTAAAKIEKAAKKAPAKAKAAVKKVEDKVVADEIETKKVAAKTTRTVKDAVKKTATKAEKAVKKPAAKAKAAKLEIIVQSPMGGNITSEEIAAKVPAGAESVFVRVDQNKLWWIKGEETGSVDIW